MSVWVWGRSREGRENQWKGDQEKGGREGSEDEGGEVLGRVHFATYSLTGCCYGRMSVATEVPIAKAATVNRRHNTSGAGPLYCILHTRGLTTRAPRSAQAAIARVLQSRSTQGCIYSYRIRK